MNVTFNEERFCALNEAISYTHQLEDILRAWALLSVHRTVLRLTLDWITGGLHQPTNILEGREQATKELEMGTLWKAVAVEEIFVYWRFCGQ